MKRSHVVTAILSGMAFALPAAAAPIIYNNEAAFRAAAGLVTSYGFEVHNLAESAELTSPLAAGDLDNHFDLAYTNLNSFQIIDNAAAAGVADGTHYLFTHSQATAPNYTLTFSNFGSANNSITAFGLTLTDFASNLTANDPVATITYTAGALAGTLLTVFAGQPDYTQNFIGLTVDPADAFTSITLTLNDNLSGFQDVDEIIYSSTAAAPAPGTAALLGLGLCTFIFRRNKTGRGR